MIRYDKQVKVYGVYEKVSDGLGGHYTKETLLATLLGSLIDMKVNEFGSAEYKRLVLFGTLPRGSKVVLVDGVRYEVVEVLNGPKPVMVVKPL